MHPFCEGLAGLSGPLRSGTTLKSACEVTLGTQAFSCQLADLTVVMGAGWGDKETAWKERSLAHSHGAMRPKPSAEWSLESRGMCAGTTVIKRNHSKQVRFHRNLQPSGDEGVRLKAGAGQRRCSSRARRCNEHGCINSAASGPLQQFKSLPATDLVVGDLEELLLRQS